MTILPFSTVDSAPAFFHGPVTFSEAGMENFEAPITSRVKIRDNSSNRRRVFICRKGSRKVPPKASGEFAELSIERALFLQKNFAVRLGQVLRIREADFADFLEKNLV